MTVPTRRPIPRAPARAVQPQTNSAFGTVIASLRTARDQAAAELARLGAQLAALDGALTALSVDANSESLPRPPAVDRPRRGRAKRGAVILSILEVLAQKGPLKPALVAATAGAKPTTVSTALDTLRKKKLAARGAAGWTLTAAGQKDLAARRRDIAANDRR